MSTEENVKKLLEYCYNNIRGGFNEPPYTAAFVASDRHMTLEEVLEAIEASSELSSFITTGQLGVKRSEPAATSNSFNNDALVKQVTYLICNEIAQGNHTPITPEFVAATLHVSLPEATDALTAAVGVISRK